MLKLITSKERREIESNLRERELETGHREHDFPSRHDNVLRYLPKNVNRDWLNYGEYTHRLVYLK